MKFLGGVSYGIFKDFINNPESGIEASKTDKNAMIGYIGMILGQISEESFWSGIKNMGYDIGVHDKDRETGIPDLSNYLGTIETEFIRYM